MSKLTILQYPDVRLKNIANPVEINDIRSQDIQTKIDDMFETMYHANGIGLAAIQVNLPIQIVTIDISPNRNAPICLINPKIAKQSNPIKFTEGCLSFPGIYVKVKRFKHITVEFLDRFAELQTIEADGLLSICVQHELDHLAGITFFDHLSALKRSLAEKKLLKMQKRMIQDK